MINVIKDLGDRAAECSMGILIMDNVSNAPTDQFRTAKQELEKEIRDKYGQATRQELKDLFPMNVFISYYKRFGYTYHVLPQLESVVKGKSIMGGLPLVEAMFMAELKNMLLTAGHDLTMIEAPVRLKTATGAEYYKDLGGRGVTTIAEDFILVDNRSVISSILRGPDQRTRISKQIRKVIYTAYAPTGINNEIIEKHLNDIEGYVSLFSGDASTSLKQII